MVELREINSENFEEIINLKVSESQATFVSTVAYSLAQAWCFKNAFPFAIYADGNAVGFVMLGYYEARKQYTLWKFLIDERYQNKGYGRKALELALNYLVNSFSINEIFTGVAIGNEIAKHLYSSVGFKTTGLVENNMEEMKYTCK